MANKVYTRDGFVEQYGGFIAHSVKGTGILAGTLIAQAIIESQGKVNGSHRVGGSKLARNSNNYFGIKCHGWKGRTYNIDTGEQNPDGTRYTDKNACFRAYDSVEDSIKDYIKFLKSNPRYEKAGVFKAKTVREQAEALKRAGYATSVKYADTVTGVYNGVSDSVEKYAKYGFSGAVKSFKNNPKAFVKRNWIPIALTGVVITGIVIGTYHIFKNKK